MKSLPKSPTIPAVTQAAGLAARAVARLEANAAAIHAEATEKRSFQAVSSKDGFSALIRHGKTVIEITGDDFAVDRRIKAGAVTCAATRRSPNHSNTAENVQMATTSITTTGGALPGAR